MTDLVATLCAVDGNRDAWSGSVRSQLEHVFGGIVSGVPLVLDKCRTCSKSRIVLTTRQPEQHNCVLAEVERGGEMVRNRIYYSAANRATLPLQESLLWLGLNNYRRILYALTDPHNKLVAGFVVGAKVGKRKVDPATEKFFPDNAKLSKANRMELLASLVLGWRQA